MNRIVLLCIGWTLLLCGCYNSLREDGVMSVGDDIVQMIYFESKQDVLPFMEEIFDRFGKPNGKDQRIRSRLVWNNVKDTAIHPEPFQLFIDPGHSIRDQGRRVNMISIAILDQNDRSILVKKTPQQRAIKAYFQAIIDETLK
ncbi:MAG: hypothetical protein AAFV25_26515 [Bacteroidota bacterium]